MTVKTGVQPSVRFSMVGPNSFQGVAFLPKIVTFELTVTATGNNDFFVAPVATYVSRAFIRVETGLNGSGTVTLGTDGDADALITTTAFDAATPGNYANSMDVDPTGLYLPAGDTLRLAVGGTATAGKVSGFLEMFELTPMLAAGSKHFELTV